MTPNKLEFHIGMTIHGAPLRAVYSKDPTKNKCSWAIIKEAASQRDDTDTVAGISDEAMEHLIEAYQFMKERMK